MNHRSWIILAISSVLPFASSNLAAMPIRAQSPAMVGLIGQLGRSLEIQKQAPPIRIPTEGDILQFYDSLYLDAFGSAFDANESTFLLDTEVTGPGTYTGANEHNQAFTLVVEEFQQVPNPSSEVDAATAQWMGSSGFQAGSIKGTLLGPAGSLELTGTVSSFDDAASSGGRLHWMVPEFDTSLHDFANGLLSESEPESVSASTGPIEECVEVYDVDDGNEDCQGCTSAYNAQIAAAEQTYNDAVSESVANYHLAVADASIDFQSSKSSAATAFGFCVAAAEATMVAAMAGCAVLGVLAPPCILAAITTKAIAVAACAASLAVKINEAKNRRSTAESRAARNFLNAQASAQNAFRNATASANAALVACYNASGCTEELEAIEKCDIYGTNQ